MGWVALPKFATVRDVVQPRRGGAHGRGSRGDKWEAAIVDYRGNNAPTSASTGRFVLFVSTPAVLEMLALKKKSERLKLNFKLIHCLCQLQLLMELQIDTKFAPFGPQMRELGPIYSRIRDFFFKMVLVPSGDGSSKGSNTAPCSEFCSSNPDLKQDFKLSKSD